MSNFELKSEERMGIKANSQPCFLGITVFFVISVPFSSVVTVFSGCFSNMYCLLMKLCDKKYTLYSYANLFPILFGFHRNIDLDI